MFESSKQRELMGERQQKFLRLKDQRTVLETYCQDITQFFDPDRGRYPGDDMKPDQLHGQRMNRILDSATMEALEIAQNGMHSGLTPSSRPWFRLEFEDDALNKYGSSRNWLEKLSDRVNRVLRQGGFYPSIHSSYGEILIFANGCISRSRYPDKGLIYRDLTFGEYWWSSSVSGKVDTLFRSWWMTAKQIVEKFGEKNVSAQVKGDYDKFPYNSYEIIHCVQPRKQYSPWKKDARNMPFESVWWENMSAAELSAQQSNQSTQAPHFLKESGFPKFPYYCPRWKVIGSNMYGGSCPGMKQLGEAKYLQDIKESLIIAVHKELDPPVVADEGLRGISIRSGAGGITYADMSSNPNQKRLEALYNVKFNIEAGMNLMQESKTAIKNGFFNQLFLMLLNIENQADRVTAEQVRQMEAQGLLQLGPFIEHMEEDVLKDVVEDAIDEILEFPEWYLLEKPPREVQGQRVDITFISMLAQAQREVGKQAIDEYLTTVSAASATWPDARDLVDVDEAMRTRANITGVPPRIVPSEDVVKATREARQKQMEAEKAQQGMQQALSGAKDLSQMSLDPRSPSALLKLLEATGGTPQ